MSPLLSPIKIKTHSLFYLTKSFFRGNLMACRPDVSGHAFHCVPNEVFRVSIKGFVWQSVCALRNRGDW